MSNLSTEDPYPSTSIDLKCKERVTDSDSENGSGDEGDRKVPHNLLLKHCSCLVFVMLLGQLWSGNPLQKKS